MEHGTLYNNRWMISMTIDLEVAKRKLAETLPLLRDRYKVESIGVFGSYVKNQQREGSDLDVLVVFSETIDLFTLVELQNFLTELLQVKVDLTLQRSLKPRIREKILREVVYV